VICLEGAQIIGKTDLEEWLKKLPSTALAKSPAFVLHEKDSLWVPFGTMPLLVGVPSHRFDAKDVVVPHASGKPPVTAPVGDAVQFAFTLHYDPNVASTDAQLRLYTAAQLIQAAPKIFKGIKSHPDFQSWEAGLKAGSEGQED